MLRITCPYCGTRDEREFACGGQSHIDRPALEGTSDEAWRAYLYERNNPVGWEYERWLHVGGCGQWFNVARNASDNRMAASYKMGDPKPEVEQ